MKFGVELCSLVSARLQFSYNESYFEKVLVAGEIRPERKPREIEG